ncbi:MAG: hypothetical protein MJ252_21535 [archaeon]|nr:hypothetical protein [archaeon]
MLPQRSFSFRAGKMPITNGKAIPSKDNGLITIYPNPEGFLMFQWKNIDTNVSDEPLVILPGDWIWKKINSPKGIIYMMKSNTYEDQKYFFYGQFDSSKEQLYTGIMTQIMEKGSLNDINIPIEATAFGQMMNLQGMMRNPPQQQRPIQGQPQGQNNMSNLDFIKNLSNSLQNLKKAYPDLSKILTKQNILKACENLNEAQMKEIFDLMPEGQQNMQGFQDNITSPQFLQALNHLSAALNSENLSAVIASFGLNLATAAKCLNGVEAFIRCIIEKNKK